MKKMKAKAKPKPDAKRPTHLFTRKEVAAIGRLVQHHAEDGDALGESAKFLFKVLDKKQPAWRAWTETLRHDAP